MIVSIAVYFALTWGFDVWGIFTSNTFGLDDVWRSQSVFGVGRYLGLGPVGLIKLAAVFGAIKLTVVGVCILHILDRVRAIFGGEADPEILEAGLMLAISLGVIAIIPAVLHHNNGVVREHAVDLLLAGIAVALCLLERSRARGQAAVMPSRALALAGLPGGTGVATERRWYAPWR
jgi:hypothetical protein